MFIAICLTGGVQSNSSGHIQALQTPDMVVNRGSLGVHRISAQQPAGGVAVSYGPNRGYVDRRIKFQNRVYVKRVSVDYDRTTVKLYQPLQYAGMQLNMYVPDAYYGPRFYFWLGTPWSSPIAYKWASSSATQSYYGDYYRPASVYTSPNQWMTDYVITSSLKDAQAAPETGGETSAALGMAEDLPVVAAPVNAPIPPEVRAAVNTQVAQVVASERLEASRVPPIRRLSC